MHKVSEDWLHRVRAACGSGSDNLALATGFWTFAVSIWITVGTCSFKPGFGAIEAGAGVLAWLAPSAGGWFLYKYLTTRGSAHKLIDEALQKRSADEASGSNKT
jgi:hypothetical protein